jgi:phosphohistidine phosphatase
MRVYFLRHGRAAVRGEWAGADGERPLTADGAEQLHREAEAMKRLELGLGLIVTSPYVRAYQTAEIVAEHLDMRDRLVTDERLEPGFGSAELGAILSENETAAAIMFVGHEPDFSTTIGRLTGGGRVVCKKGGLARVDLAEATDRHGELVWLIPPGALG